MSSEPAFTGHQEKATRDTTPEEYISDYVKINREKLLSRVSDFKHLVTQKSITDDERRVRIVMFNLIKIAEDVAVYDPKAFKWIEHPTYLLCKRILEEDEIKVRLGIAAEIWEAVQRHPRFENMKVFYDLAGTLDDVKWQVKVEDTCTCCIDPWW